MKDVNRLTIKFRDAIDAAKNAGDFNKDFSFCNFPIGCCGDASVLLAQFLLASGIRTYYVCGTCRDGSFENIQSHAWLLADKQTIIDITGDQFKYNSHFLNYDKPAYIGAMDNFHRLFKVEKRDVHETVDIDELNSMCKPRLNELYRIISKYT